MHISPCIGRDVGHWHLAPGCCIWCRLYSRCPLQRWPEVGHLIREKFSSRQQKTPPVDEADEKYLNSTTICLYSFCSPYATWTARILLVDDYNIHLPQVRVSWWVLISVGTSPWSCCEKHDCLLEERFVPSHTVGVESGHAAEWPFVNVFTLVRSVFYL